MADHLAAIEPFYELCIVLGFGLGAKNTTSKAGVPDLEVLGDNIGREGRTPLDCHLKAIREWSELRDLLPLNSSLVDFNGCGSTSPWSTLLRCRP